MPFRLTLDKTFQRRLKKKAPDQVGAVLRCVEQLGKDPRHPGLRTHPIKGAPGTFEAYVDRSNRVSWTYGKPGEIVLLNHCSHDDVLP